MKKCPNCNSTRYKEIRSKGGILLKAYCPKCGFKSGIEIDRKNIETSKQLSKFETNTLERTLERHKESFKELGKN